jgi:copper(I)-binding protein
MSLTRHLVRGTAAALVGVVALAACASDGGSTGAGDTKAKPKTVKVTDAWARDTAEGQTRGAVYLTVVNETDEDVDIIGASVPTSISAETQVHESLTEGDSMGDSGMDESTSSTSMAMDESTSSTSMGMGDAGAMTTMREVPKVTVPAGATVMFEPGGYHVMLMDLDHPLTVGETFPVTLMLDGGASVKATVTVRSA